MNSKGLKLLWVCLSSLVFSFLPVSETMAQSDVVFDVRRVIVNLDYGQVLGWTSKVKAGEEISTLGYGSFKYGDDFIAVSNFSEAHIRENFSESMVDRGFLVKGYGDVFEELKKQQVSDYAIAFSVDSFAFNYFVPFGAFQYNLFSSVLYVRVRVLSKISDSIVLNKTINSTYFSKEEGFSVGSNNFSNYIPKMFDQFVSDLQVDSDFQQLLIKKSSTSEMLPDSSFILPARTVDSPTPLAEALSSVVTLKRGSSHGSGAIISADGLILTCYHNLYAAEEVDVVLSNGITAKAKVIRKDREYDLALLQLKGLQANPLYISDRGASNPGEDAWVIGTPGFAELGQSITKGVISGNRIIEGKEYVQTDASISPGNSGGPLLDSDGRIVGIVNAKVVAKGMEGIGFAIPSKVIFERLGLAYR